MKEMIIVIGIALLTFSPNLMANDRTTKENFCDEIQLSYEQTGYKHPAYDECFDVHGESRKTGRRLQREGEESGRQQAERELVIAAQNNVREHTFTRSQISRKLTGLNGVSIISRRFRGYNINQTIDGELVEVRVALLSGRAAEKVRVMSDPHYICQRMLEDVDKDFSKSKATSVVESSRDYREESNSGFVINKDDDYPLSCYSRDNKSKHRCRKNRENRAVKYIKEITCVEVTDRRFEDRLDFFEGVDYLIEEGSRSTQPSAQNNSSRPQTEEVGGEDFTCYDCPSTLEDNKKQAGGV